MDSSRRGVRLKNLAIVPTIHRGMAEQQWKKTIDTECPNTSLCKLWRQRQPCHYLVQWVQEA
jgi:hypothetical protein